MKAREPGQVRKEAALSGHLQARRERRFGASKRRSRLGYGIDRGCTVHFLAPVRTGGGGRLVALVRTPSAAAGRLVAFVRTPSAAVRSALAGARGGLGADH